MANPEISQNSAKETKKKEAPIEIERKFLVRKPPENLEEFSSKKVIQGYLAVMGDGTEVRLRKKGEKYFQTVKSGGTNVREEFEVEISQEQFDVLWPATAKRRIEKTRYEIPDGVAIIELDIYHGRLSGLITAEVEFDTTEGSYNFTPPD